MRSKLLACEHAANACSSQTINLQVLSTRCGACSSHRAQPALGVVFAHTPSYSVQPPATRIGLAGRSMYRVLARSVVLGTGTTCTYQCCREGAYVDDIAALLQIQSSCISHGLGAQENARTVEQQAMKQAARMIWYLVRRGVHANERRPSAKLPSHCSSATSSRHAQEGRWASSCAPRLHAQRLRRCRRGEAVTSAKRMRSSGRLCSARLVQAGSAIMGMAASLLPLLLLVVVVEVVVVGGMDCMVCGSMRRVSGP
jgi:hypothetical protein